MTMPTMPPPSEAPLHRFERAGLGKAPFRVVGNYESKYQACHGAPVQPGTSCDFCGTGIMDVFVIQSSDRRRFKVGCDCVHKTGDAGLIRAVKREQSTRRAAKREEKLASARETRRAANLERANAWLIAHPGVAAMLGADEPTIQDIKQKLFLYGEISERQVALVERIYTDYLHQNAPGCALPPEVDVPLYSGRVELDVAIIGTRTDEGLYGRSTTKALYQVRTPDGYWKAWGTLPSGLERPESGTRRGQAFRLRAAVERSHDDSKFAFLKRPTLVTGRDNRRVR